MKKLQLLSLAVTLAASTAVAQSPQPEIQQTHGLKAAKQQVHDYAADVYAAKHVHMNSFAGHKYRGHEGYTAPANAYYGGYHAGGQYCPQDYCGDNGWYPKHTYTYGYQRPQHLVYPQPNATGGAVVYPYYTHKGPSDFFRK